VAKRSPILGYNHNVRYRGLVFHVQTEDSGVLSPHLFTHLFYEGVIVSTRKLVYDAGANEEAIKALMQAQHKAVMKDLRKGAFDDKIDAYLGGTPGLEPSANAPAGPPPKKGERAKTDVTPPPPELVAAINDAPTEATAVPIETLPAGDQSVPIELTVAKPRTQTAQSGKDKLPPLPTDLDAPTVSDNASAVAAAIAQANAAATRSPTGQRAATPPPIPRVPTGQRPATPPPIPARDESQPEIEITADDSNRNRAPRDTEVGEPELPPVKAPAKRRSRDSSQPPRRTPTGDRPASHAAGALPPVTRAAVPRPSITPPTVIARSLNDGRVKKANEGEISDAIEVYAPAPASAEPPPGAKPAERPGQYSVSRANPPSDKVQLRESTGPMPPIAKPRGTPPSAPPQNVRMATPATGNAAVRAKSEVGKPLGKEPTPSSGVPRIPDRTGTQPVASRGGPPASNVVMTRPAVIVGAPPKPATAPVQRVRKAREDEGRGFGSGLISEKSLDEVILAYLSEDAEEK
jgi:hypothetical protein